MKYSKQREHILKIARRQRQMCIRDSPQGNALAQSGNGLPQPEPAGGKRHYPQNRRAGRFGSL